MVAVVTPIYKPFHELAESELASLRSSCKNLQRYSHVLVGPKNIGWSDYRDFYRQYQINPIFKPFDSYYFDSIRGYNKLLKSHIFYTALSAYEFILILQTDAYVFRDELEFWCNKDWDYVGAPWFDGYHDAKHGSILIGVGNGGFSLRKVETFKRIARRIKLLTYLEKFWRRSGIGMLIPFMELLAAIKTLLKIKRLEKVPSMLLNSCVNEDIYWGDIVEATFDDFILAPLTDAIGFSFEANPSHLYTINNYALPFGCHGWLKYEPSFWKQFIKIKECKE